jgi:uracil-DNA glycosylase family protein
MPKSQTLLRAASRDAAACRACPLWERATQTVFGEGPADAALVLVGEQPGDEEDLAGAPFVGPAGRLLDDALEAAGLERSQLYVTNAVKHFKWKPRGKRRIHDKPNRTEVVACHQWLDAELGAVDPDVVVALGATAGQALLGPRFRVGASRGVALEVEGRPLVATIHPSAVLRARDHDERVASFDGLVADLARARDLLAS